MGIESRSNPSMQEVLDLDKRGFGVEAILYLINYRQSLPNRIGYDQFILADKAVDFSVADPTVSLPLSQEEKYAAFNEWCMQNGKSYLVEARDLPPYINDLPAQYRYTQGVDDLLRSGLNAKQAIDTVRYKWSLKSDADKEEVPVFTPGEQLKRVKLLVQQGRYNEYPQDKPSESQSPLLLPPHPWKTLKAEIKAGVFSDYGIQEPDSLTIRFAELYVRNDTEVLQLGSFSDQERAELVEEIVQYQRQINLLVNSDSRKKKGTWQAPWENFPYEVESETVSIYPELLNSLGQDEVKLEVVKRPGGTIIVKSSPEGYFGFSIPNDGSSILFYKGAIYLSGEAGSRRTYYLCKGYFGYNIQKAEINPVISESLQMALSYIEDRCK